MACWVCGRGSDRGARGQGEEDRRDGDGRVKGRRGHVGGGLRCGCCGRANALPGSAVPHRAVRVGVRVLGIERVEHEGRLETAARVVGALRARRAARRAVAGDGAGTAAGPDRLDGLEVDRPPTLTLSLVNPLPLDLLQRPPSPFHLHGNRQSGKHRRRRRRLSRLSESVVAGRVTAVETVVVAVVAAAVGQGVPVLVVLLLLLPDTPLGAGGGEGLGVDRSGGSG